MWQPIETYDGSYSVLLFDPRIGQFVGDHDGYGWYIVGDGTEYHEEGALRPTHWRPLDNPPT